MVDVTPKEPTFRRAVARGRVYMKPETTSLVARGAVTKGDVLAVARVAAIQAAKRTSDLVPLCHQVTIGAVSVNFDITDDYIEIESHVDTVDRTGVEMEALMACSVAALTIYDMCKSADREMEIGDIALWEKTGGRSGTYKRGVRLRRLNRQRGLHVMMVVIQVAVAGTLLLAWIWVLGRPQGGRRGVDDRSVDDQRAEPTGGRPADAPVPLLGWSRRDVTSIRRQLMLATLLATFIAFFLAIALRGPFVWVFAVTVAISVVHLVVASVIGGRMVARREAEADAAWIDRMRHAPAASAFDLAASIRADLEPGGGTGATDMVSALIDEAWGDASSAADTNTATDVDTDTDTDTDVDADADADADTDRGTGPAAQAESVFVRAVKDTTARDRRQARPVYIESQLDEPTEPAARAANQH